MYQRNRSGEIADGVALAIKRGIQHRIIDDIEQEFLAVENDTSRGPVVLSTGFLPPRQLFLPYLDILRLLWLCVPIYLLGDLNARHRSFRNSDNNTIGTSIIRLIAAISPDIILCNRYSHFNYHITPGNLTTNDHSPIILDISTNPILIPPTPRPDYKHADWSRYKELLDDKPPIELDRKPPIEIDKEMKKWNLANLRGWTQDLRQKYIHIRE